MALTVPNTFTGRSCDDSSMQDKIAGTADRTPTTPICGWFIANHMSNAIMVFNHKGAHIGSLVSIDAKAERYLRWDNPPDSIDAYAHDYAVIKSSDLWAVIAWILEAPKESGTGVAFVDWFLALSQTPAAGTYDQSETQAIILGSPYAIVAASPAPNQILLSRDNSFQQNLDRQSGLIGYWSSLAKPNAKGEAVSPYQTVNSQSSRLILLADPRAERTVQIAFSEDTNTTIEMSNPQIELIEKSFLTSPLIVNSTIAETPPSAAGELSWKWSHDTGPIPPSPKTISQTKSEGWITLRGANRPKP